MRHKSAISAALMALSAAFIALPANALDAEIRVGAPVTNLTCGSSIYGAWVTNEGNSVVNIFDCGSSEVCGDVVKFEGDAKYNDANPYAATALANQSGRRVLTAFHAETSKKFKGRIINPRNGKSYKSTLKVSKMGDLKVKGCLGPLCDTKTWMRPKVCS